MNICQPDTPDRKTELLFRSHSQFPDYDTEEGVSTVDVLKDCIVLFDDRLQKKPKIFTSYSPVEVMKILTCIFYHNVILSYRY